MWVEKLSAALGLAPCDQDWGICNADPDRVVEFIRFFKANVADHPWEPEALAELIFHSMNDALERPDAPEELREQVRNFVRNCSPAFPQTLEYWLRLIENEDFPVVQLVGEALPKERLPPFD